MGLRVNTNVEALNIHRNLLTTNNNLANQMKKLSSGHRINTAKDDASGYAVANAFKTRISSMKVARQNVSEADAMLQVFDGALNKVHDILGRMKDLATQASSEQTDRSRLSEEFTALQAEIDRITQSTKYNDVDALHSKATTNITFQVGYECASGNSITLQFTAACSSALGVSSTDISVSSMASAQSAMDTIDTALTTVNQKMSQIGSYQNRLQITFDNLSVGIENFSSMESTIRDADMAAEMMDFTKNQILSQSGMAMLSQANMAPQQVLQILG